MTASCTVKVPSQSDSRIRRHAMSTRPATPVPGSDERPPFVLKINDEQREKHGRAPPVERLLDRLRRELIRAVDSNPVGMGVEIVVTAIVKRRATSPTKDEGELGAPGPQDGITPGHL